MAKIEDTNVSDRKGLTGEIRDFWSRNVNAERVFGKEVSSHDRGDERYFNDLEVQRYRSHRHLIPWIQSMAPGTSCLEIGCGIGMDSIKIAGHGLQITSLDLTSVGVATAMHRFRASGVEGSFLVGDACSLPIEDESFDFVYSFGVLHHAADTEKCIREAYRVLRKGGSALIMLYNRHSLNELVHRITGVPFEEKDELCPVVRRFTRKEVREIFSQYSDIEIHKDFVYGEGYGFLFRLTPQFLYRWMSRLFGWHLMIRATK